MPIKALIFDLDGTLVDTAPDLLNATNHVLASIDRKPLQIEQLRRFVGHGAKALIERGLAATGGSVDATTFDQLHRSFLDYYAKNIAVDSVTFDGLTAFLDSAEGAGLKLGVCTNKLAGLSRLLLAELGLLDRFGSVIGGDTLPLMKPDPAPLREAAARLGATTQEIIMIGDSETDIRTAQNASAVVIAVTFGYTSQPVQAFAPNHTIDHYNEAWPLVSRYIRETT